MAHNIKRILPTNELAPWLKQEIENEEKGGDDVCIGLVIKLFGVVG
jgi:hypothetical protein